MTPLHDLETNEALNTYTHGAMKESLCHIVAYSSETVPLWEEAFMEDMVSQMF